LPPSELKVAEK